MKKKAKAAGLKREHFIQALDAELTARYHGWTEKDRTAFVSSVVRRADLLATPPPAEGPEPVEIAKENAETDRDLA